MGAAVAKGFREALPQRIAHFGLPDEDQEDGKTLQGVADISHDSRVGWAAHQQ